MFGIVSLMRWRPRVRSMIEWLDAANFTLDDQRYLIDVSTELATLRSTSDRFVLGKTREMVERFMVRFAGREDVRRIVELGIFQGGSVALECSACRPERLVAVDLHPDPVAPLEDFVLRRGLKDRVHLFYGVDQADRDTLGSIVATEFGGAPLDLVIDDASHHYGPTRASFELLFPLLRDGGVYVIEDWDWSHYPGDFWQQNGGYAPGQPALTNLVVEILMLAGTRPDIVREVKILSRVAEVVRGPAPLAGPMELSDLFLNRGVSFEPSL